MLSKKSRTYLTNKKCFFRNLSFSLLMPAGSRHHHWETTRETIAATTMDGALLCAGGIPYIISLSLQSNHKVKQLAQGYTANKEWRWNLNRSGWLHCSCISHCAPLQLRSRPLRQILLSRVSYLLDSCPFSASWVAYLEGLEKGAWMSGITLLITGSQSGPHNRITWGFYQNSTKFY